jgi:hypothetical protein
MRPLKERKYAKKFIGKSLTQQQFKESADINTMMEKYSKTGQISVSDKEALYGDFSNVPDYIEAFNIVENAQKQFKALPSALRQELDGSPSKFLEFVADPKNTDRLVELGLAEKPPQPTPQPAPVAEPAPTGAGSATE